MLKSQQRMQKRKEVLFFTLSLIIVTGGKNALEIVSSGCLETPRFRKTSCAGL